MAARLGGFTECVCIAYSLLFEQPVVFFGAEGELGIVAANLSDYLWLLAAGDRVWNVRVRDQGGTLATLEHLACVALVRSESADSLFVRGL